MAFAISEKCFVLRISNVHSPHVLFQRILLRLFVRRYEKGNNLCIYLYNIYRYAFEHCFLVKSNTMRLTRIAIRD